MIDSKPGRPPSPFQLPLTRQIQRFLPALFTSFIILYFLIHSSWRDPSLQTVSKARDFPKKIWQLWKVDVLSLEERDLPRAKSWIQNNPGHRYEVLADDNDIQYVETAYGPDGLNRPDIVHMYRSITARIVKADILRYLVMYA